MYYDGNKVFIFIHVINLISNLIIQSKLQEEDTEQNNVFFFGT